MSAGAGLPSVLLEDDVALPCSEEGNGSGGGGDGRTSLSLYVECAGGLCTGPPYSDIRLYISPA